MSHSFFGGRATVMHFAGIEDSRGVLVPIDFAALQFTPVRSFFVNGRDGIARGGHAHRRGRQLLLRVSGEIRIDMRLDGVWKTDFPNAKVLVAHLKEGDAFRIQSGGGGGYGSPKERSAEQVGEDVRQGYVGVKEAKELYGVVVDPVTLAVDEEATARLRGAI